MLFENLLSHQMSSDSFKLDCSNITPLFCNGTFNSSEDVKDSGGLVAEWSTALL